MKKTLSKDYLWLSLLLSSVLPILLGLTLSNLYPDWRWSQYPFHSMLESIGSLSALTIATLMIIMVKNNHLSRLYILIACALTGMGLLDGFHAVLHVGTAFVWLHSIATMVGGLIFSTIWLPQSLLTKERQRYLIFITIIASLSVGIISVAIPEILPTMVVDGQFSSLAKAINFIGGAGFLIGTSYFIYAYYKQGRRDENTKINHNGDIVFANHCLLFGVAALLFETSVLWDAGWWWWHILRLSAYIIVLTYFFILFNNEQTRLKRNENKLELLNNHLELRVESRTIELKEAKEIADKANVAKSQFLSSMSHELRTPLNAILGFSQVLELDKDMLSENHNSAVQDILGGGHHLLHLINEVLDLAKIESGTFECRIEEVSLKETIAQCSKLINKLAEKSNIKIDYGDPENYMILADPQRIKQVLINYLSNAIKYNSPNGHVTINYQTVEENRLRIKVTDIGIGINESDLAMLFKPFTRVGNKSTNIEGTGIGLVISKELMTLMDGAVGVSSVVGEGSTFWFEIRLS